MVSRKENHITPMPCLSGKDLFSQPKLRHYLNEIKNVVSCPQNLFLSLYVETLHWFGEFCQAMPLNAECLDDYSLLKRQLDLVIGSLKLRRGLFLPKGANAEKIAVEEPQWTFALFSAALLKDISHVAVDRDVSLYHKNNEPAGQWHILSGSLYESNLYYTVDLAPNHKVNIPDEVVMGALIGRILPAMAIRWLSENRQLYEYWLAILFDKRIIQNELLDIITMVENKLNLPKFFRGNTSTIENKKSDHYQDFIHWITENYKNYSDAIFRYKDGLFVSEAVVNDYLSEKSTSKDSLFTALQKQTALIENEDGYTHKLMSKNFENQIVLKGILLHDIVFNASLSIFPLNANYIKHFEL